MNQNLSSYYVFYIVARAGNISAASKELYISQPAVSKSVTKLESNLGTKLLIRSSRGVSLTNEGKILYDRLAQAFHAIELGEEQLKYESNSEAWHITIGASTTLCKYVLLPHLKEFVRHYPHVRISISCQSTYETIKALEDRSIDIGLVGESVANKEYEFKPVEPIRDIFVATKSYLENLSIRTGIDYKDTSKSNTLFSNATLMLMDKENLSRRFVDQYLVSNEIQAGNMIEVSTMDLLIEFATIGLGIACVIKNFVEDELKDGTLVEIPVPFSMSERNIGLLYRDKQFKNPALDAFLSQYEKK